MGRSLDVEKVLQLFESDLQLYIAERARGRVFIHAGAVGWQGRAILIPGRSLSGKSTLVAELVKAGATYYSDEYAVLDARGRVHPYPRWLGFRHDGDASSQRVPVEWLGGVMGSRPLPVGLVVVTTYKQSARWRPRRLSAGKGALELLDNTVSIQRKPEAALPVLSRVASEAAILKGARGEAKEAAELILSKMPLF